MKQLLIVLFLGISSIVYSQDTTKIPTQELEEFFLALDTLETQDSLKSILISELEKEIKLHELLSRQDSLIIKFKDEEIELLNHQIDLHLDRLNYVDKWYKKPWIGVAGGFIGTIVLIHTIDYTLPQ